MRIRTALAWGVLLLAVGTVPAAGAQQQVDSAYWWVAQNGSAPPPAQVPPGGLYVASTAAGATAVSAVRLRLAPDQTVTRLDLTTHQVSSLDELSVDAYVTADAWKPGDAQPWSTRPAAAQGAVRMHGVLQPDQTTLRFDLSTAHCLTTCSIVLVPGAPSAAPTAGVAPTATFDASFERVTPQAFTLAAAAGKPVAPTTTGSISDAVPPAAPPPAHRTEALTPALPLGPVGLAAATRGRPLTAVAQPLVPPPALQRVTPVLDGHTTRSGRATAALAMLLAAVTFYVGWRARAAAGDGTSRTTIYDLPPAATDG